MQFRIQDLFYGELLLLFRIFQIVLHILYLYHQDFRR